ncbi:hypothetical protein AMD27_11490 [Acinetobacter sp. TGL-Y2]|nr:hypothetical protein AMD27_11490 [Acinetobacter sp. TGL-Y2]
MQNLIKIDNNLQGSNDLILISKKELRSLYRKIIECEKIIEEYKNKEKMQSEQQKTLSINE